MLKNQEPDWNIDDLTDTEIYAAIRYLEADAKTEDKEDADQGKDDGVVICVCLYILLFGCMAFLCFCWR
jgi:hypothetical protein